MLLQHKAPNINLIHARWGAGIIWAGSQAVILLGVLAGEEEGQEMQMGRKSGE